MIEKISKTKSFSDGRPDQYVILMIKNESIDYVNYTDNGDRYKDAIEALTPKYGKIDAIKLVTNYFN